MFAVSFLYVCLPWLECDVGVPTGICSWKCVGLGMLDWACLFLFASFCCLGVFVLLCLFRAPGSRVLVDVFYCLGCVATGCVGLGLLFCLRLLGVANLCLPV